MPTPTDFLSYEDRHALEVLEEVFPHLDMELGLGRDVSCFGKRLKIQKLLRAK